MVVLSFARRTISLSRSKCRLICALRSSAMVAAVGRPAAKAAKAASLSRKVRT
jgi:hypothetical protein